MRRVPAALVAVALLTGGCTGNAGSTGSADGRPSPSHSADTGAGGLTPVQPLRKALPAIERFVEHERGLRFKHPVQVRLLGRKAFLKKLRGEQGQPKPAEVEQLTSTLAALGLISPRLDVVKAFRTAYDAGTLGFYDFKDKHLYVRGTQATPGVRAVLAHELTHALDDQWFGLRRPQLRKDNQEKELAFTALSEGDAERTRIDYEATMTKADQSVAKREEGATAEPPHVPQTVLILIGLPYIIGPEFVKALVAHNGNSAIDAGFRTPPVSSEQLFDVAAYFSHDAPKHVATPRSDGVRVDHSDLGFIGLLLALQKHVGTALARQAVAGWGGDQYSTWRAGDHRWCLRDTIVMDYAAATQILDSALHKWVSTSHGRARLESTGARTTFVSCSS
ncbi:MAG TPA: hypothetical protein VFJ17_14405 [Mycobacteriales bacterium]|jgi:hypothetical protein|nr:hypothetical protein [Mycobacteriales bacterium]